MTGHILMERDGALAIITLNNPARLNAINPDMRNAVRHHLEELMDDPECRAIVLTGAAGNFSAGGDVSKFGQSGLLGGRSRQALGIRTIPLIAAGPKPVVAAVEGYCYGMAMGYAMACDYVVASVTARFCSAAPKIGLSAQEHGLVWSVPKRIGWAKAKKLLTLATVVSGEEAGRIGLADEVVGAGEALAAAKAVAMEFASVAPVAFALTKSAMAAGLDEALRVELDHQSAILLTKDHEEGKRAFLEKRPPVFRGE